MRIRQQPCQKAAHRWRQARGGKRIRLRTPNKSITFNTNNGEQSEPLPIPFKKKERKEKTRNMKHETYPSVPGRYRHAWGRMKGALWTPR